MNTAARIRVVRGLRAAHRPVLFDVVLAAAAVIVEVGLLFNDGTEAVPLPIAVTVLTGAVLLARRRFGVAVTAVAVASAAVVTAAGYSPGGAPAVVALWSLAETRDRRVSLAVLAPVAVFLEVDNVCSPPVSIGAWALGAYMRTRRRYVQAVEDRAATLEREREQLDLIAAQRERGAIARELHDIVAHSVTVMLIGVRGARDVLETEPRVAARTLEQVEASAEQSLAELRRILVLLRGREAAETRPQPSLADLDDLVAGYRAAGLPVRLEITGEPLDLPSGVELSAYRIIEEALTNALKHAGATLVTVRLFYGGADLEVRVQDDGTATGEPGPGGHGLVGMRERVAVLGGELETGRAPGGGFRVAARLPVGGRA
ncbi:signal transduction histidine kinase [Actinomadura coerulea]|uniref:histidine kinase n=1 Tax=Actinomadura coerulea TaxID=46159 RepID=A0A7X0G5A5_9ACTN|nr:signal transduction histidine kinase [Actinomadura coerulea]GGP97773.1 two-component sensor histidine kinase [Actinomadura coerulea]